MKIGVVGAGSWGSALAINFSKIANICLWCRSKAQAELLATNRTNLAYLSPDIFFPDNIWITHQFSELLNSDLLIIATPLNGLREIFSKLSSYPNIPDIIWAAKGFEANSGLLPHEIINQVLVNFKNYGALLGPSFANEVVNGLPTAITLSSFEADFAKKWMYKLVNIPNFRIYAHNDLIGSEIGAAVKNVLAIAVGIADGLGLGYNARAALMTRGLNELGKLVLALGGKKETIYGLTGIGDLILTCTGELSRNRKVGLELAKGHDITDIMKNLGHVAEGVVTAREIYNKSLQLNIEMPIVQSVYKIIYASANIKNEVNDLINREPKLEF